MSEALKASKLGILLSIFLVSTSFAAEGNKKVFTQSFSVDSELNSKRVQLQVQMDGESATIRTIGDALEGSKAYLAHGIKLQELQSPLKVKAKKFFISKESSWASKVVLYFIDPSNVLHQMVWNVGDAHSPSRVEISPLIKMGRFTDFTIGHESPFGQPYTLTMGHGNEIHEVPGNDKVTPITLFSPGVEKGEVWLKSDGFGSVMKIADIKADPKTMKPVALHFPEELPGNLARMTGFSGPVDFLKATSPWQDPVSGERARGPRFPVVDASKRQRLVESKVRDPKVDGIQEVHLADAQVHSVESEVKVRAFSKVDLPKFEKRLRTPKQNMDLETAHALIELRVKSDQMIPALTDIALQPQKKRTLWVGSSKPSTRTIDRSTEAVDLLAKYSEIDPRALAALEKVKAESKSQSARKRAIASIAKIREHLPHPEFMRCFLGFVKLLGTDSSHF